MANELLIGSPTGSTLYALLFDTTGRVWDGSSFAEPSSAAWAGYGIAMVEIATMTGLYRASMPAVAAGSYSWTVRKQAGGAPAVADIAVGAGEIRWTGTAEETVPASVNVATVNGSPVKSESDGRLLVDLSDNAIARIANAIRVGSPGSKTINPRGHAPANR